MPWEIQGNCHGKAPNVMHPHSRTAKAVFAAQAVCAGCPVLDKCLRDAKARGEEWGMWGGVWFGGKIIYPKIKEKKTPAKRRRTTRPEQGPREAENTP
jgi:hypothetical protein